ncbi:hypothetical protein PPTG_04246 [Phytophthora nicotianae INRA-310]|uniref:Uncharacterized protein n=2 Tax=Phytophthora nicotianae TaxID=4792 RepID=W2R208_PHYN3|nr:hypothetical protein PPTG_04246 [Phytophthora nicotianae INRA-310]ETM36047.1 hypothetical protein L914_17174 [Phytophthora nicotianae]ETN18749.1 hypothetical protein PPTG_04246 [Phytophthora nicotianae INRA-310]
MADDEVTTLKRELEALRLQLEQERKKNAPVQGDDSSDPRQERKPEQGATQCDESSMPKRLGGDKKAAPSSKEPRIYVQHAAVGARRGKWWLRDRQVLSRAAADEDGTVTLKVRETWAWSGRTVILDKIVQLDEKLRATEVQNEKPEIEKEGPVDSEDTTKVPNVATPSSMQPSEEAETSETANTAGKETVDSMVAVEQSTAKADDEVRESSAPMVDAM